MLQHGRVVAQLEMAWPDRRIGVLLQNLPDSLRQDLRDENWNLFPVEEIDMDRGDLLSALQ